MEEQQKMIQQWASKHNWSTYVQMRLEVIIDGKVNLDTAADELD
ncbi:hypothetical protein [Lentibacillus halophilus]